jgi:hypothetical protein
MVGLCFGSAWSNRRSEHMDLPLKFVLPLRSACFVPALDRRQKGEVSFRVHLL